MLIILENRFCFSFSLLFFFNKRINPSDRFALQFFSISKYVLPFQILEDKAELFSVIVHKGASLGNGHYFAFIKFGGQWYRVDDMKV